MGFYKGNPAHRPREAANGEAGTGTRVPRRCPHYPCCSLQGAIPLITSTLGPGQSHCHLPPRLFSLFSANRGSVSLEPRVPTLLPFTYPGEGSGGWDGTRAGGDLSPRCPGPHESISSGRECPTTPSRCSKSQHLHCPPCGFASAWKNGPGSACSR